MTLCQAVGAIQVGGREVAAVRCTEEAGHGLFGISHSVTLEWRDESINALPDVALLDPDESFVEVPIVDELRD
jgi:hypothetical protein